LARTRILLADPNASMLAMTTELLGEYFEIVGAVQTSADTLRCLPETRPDLILLDVVLDDMNGFELGNQLHRMSPEAKILYFTMYEGPDFVDAAFAAGASGYVFKSRASSDLVKAVQAVCRGEQFRPTNAVRRERA
jgi:DNA-binding NarL/FixJ family response regulator